jgi:ubiquinone/menaquinone biosynthesis C-methylase UbiE
MGKFAAGAEAYDAFMGRYSVPLAAPFADAARTDGARPVLDVGCGPGALTTELTARLGPDAVHAVDPTEAFVTAARERHPGVDVRVASAEQLPFADATFGAALAQLVVHFMDDPVAGLREMARVTRPGGAVAACVWDHHGGRGPLSHLWRAAHDLDPSARGEGALAGSSEGDLERLFAAAGLRDVEGSEIAVEVEHATFEAWWEPFTFGVGPAGAYVARLDDARRAQLRDRCRELLPEPPFVVNAVAWTARGVA